MVLALVAAGAALAAGNAGGEAQDERGAGTNAGHSARAATQEARRSNPGNLVGHGGPIKAVRTDLASSRALTGSFDYAMMVWDIGGEQPRQLLRIDEHDGAVNAVAFVPGGRRVLSAGDDGTIALWELDGGRLVHRFEGHTAKVVSLAVSGDGRWAVSASWDRTARLWDLERLEPGPALSGHRAPVNAAVFSRDTGRVLTAGADGDIRLYEREDGRFVRPVYRHGWGINVLERAPGSDGIVFGALNGAAGVIDPATGALELELQAHTRPVLALAAIDKPGLIATGGGDGVIRVYRAADGALLEQHHNPFGPVWALAFTEGGRGLYYGGLDDFATLWQVSPPAPVAPVDSPFPRRFQVNPGGDGLIAQGEAQFARKCSICHTVTPDGANRAGPTLFEVLGRRIGTVPGYPYSDALRNLDIVWTEETIAKLFELGPDEFTPGSKMPLQKMTDRRQREALVAYLKAATVRDPSVRPEAGRAPPEKGDSK